MGGGRRWIRVMRVKEGKEVGNARRTEETRDQGMMMEGIRGTGRGEKAGSNRGWAIRY